MHYVQIYFELTRTNCLFRFMTGNLLNYCSEIRKDEHHVNHLCQIKMCFKSVSVFTNSQV